MAAIPQELVEVILADFHPVDDIESLKSISLTATNFAGPAQRIMFRSLALHGHEMPGWCPTFERALNLFNGSPHIAFYVQDLSVRLPIKTSPEHHNLLELVLPKLSHVRRFIIRGVGVAWDDLGPCLQSTLAKFLLGPSLDKLHLSHILGMPLTVIAIAAQTISVLSLNNVFLKTTEETLSDSGLNPRASPRLNHLILSSTRGSQFNAFLGLIVSPVYTANLQRLAVEQSDFSGDLLRAVAPTLTELILNCIQNHNRFDLPWLPCLTSLELKVKFAFSALIPIWLPAALVQLPRMMPALRLLTLSIAVSERYTHSAPSQINLARIDSPANAVALSSVDETLGGTVSRLIWDLTFGELVAEKPYYALMFARFRTAVERNMVRMREAGYMEVRYSERRGYEESLP
ncbi:hypothetical protein B0H19DRAFT_1259784 [Mycena capillaripes]|nr:hypothetical protein B0H19DRAFT_1259784 [Mycena capillaripes]